MRIIISVPARSSKRRTKKPTRRPAKPQKLVRFTVASYLSAREVRERKARAATDLKTISNYVSHLVVEELKRKRRRRSAEARPGEKRQPLPDRVVPDGGGAEAAGGDRRRGSVSGYVGRIIVAELAGQ